MLAELLTLPYSVAVNSAVLVYPLPSTTPVYADTDISLVLEESDGSVGFTPVLNTDYTVSIDASNVATITFLANTELTAGRILVVDRETERSQPVQFSELEDLPGAAIEKQVDRQVAMIQELAAQNKRSILARRGETFPDLPAKSSLLGKIFYPDAAGTSWGAMDASSVKLLADDLAQGANSSITKLSGVIAQLEVLGLLDVEIGVLGALGTEIAAIHANLTEIASVAGAIGDGTLNDLLDDQVGKVNTLADLQAYTSPTAAQVMLMSYRSDPDDGAVGFFVFESGDRTTECANDPLKGVWVPLDTDVTPGTTGAWRRKVFGDEINIAWFGAITDDAVDSAPAIQAAYDYAGIKVASMTRAGVSVWHPCGEYRCNSQVTVDNDRITLRGSGLRSSVLYTSAANGQILKVSKGGAIINSVNILGLGFEVRGNATSGSMLVLENLLDASISGLGLFGWYDGIDMIGINRCFFDHITMSQSGRTGGGGNVAVKLRGTAAAGTCSDIHIDDLQVISGSAYVYDTGVLIQGVDGVYCAKVHLIGADKNVVYDPQNTTGNDTIASVKWVSCYFDATNSGTGIDSVRHQGTASTAYKDIEYIGCTNRAAQGSGYYFGASSVVENVRFIGGTNRQHEGSGITCNNANVNGVLVMGLASNDNNKANGASDADFWIRGDRWVIMGGSAAGGGAAGRCISLNSNSTDCLVVGFDMTDTTAGTKFHNGGTGNKFDKILGLVTRNKGTATMSNPSTSITVNHGLDFTPTIADITLGFADAASGVTRLYPSNINATSFDINAVAGPSGSADLRWEVDVAA